MPSLSVEEMKTYLLGFYGDRWKERVKNKMTDRQIIASYYRIKSQEKKKT